ncbi:hypothetical protein V3N99_02880 [Dermatophilaceae bacterium Soc4.6]
MTRRDPRITVLLVSASVLSGVLAWCDMAARSGERIRGPRRLWHVLVLANPGNSVAYWVAGRRRRHDRIG